MELQQLKYFLTAAQMGHMTRAAESLFISQPALTRSIRRLEQELGQKLLARKGRGIVLTEYGQRFYSHVQRIFEELEQDELEREDLKSRRQPPIRIGTCISGVALPVLEDYHQLHPEIQFIHESFPGSKGMLEWLSAGNLDLGFCDAPLLPAALRHTILWEDQLYVLLHKSHRLSSAEVLTFSALRQETLILPDTETNLRPFITAFSGDAPAKNVMHTASMSEALRLCSLGMGITVTSGFYFNLQIQDSVHSGKSLMDFIQPVPLENCSWNIHLVWNPDHFRPSLEDFRNFIVDFYRTQTEQTILRSVAKKET